MYTWPKSALLQSFYGMVFQPAPGREMSFLPWWYNSDGVCRHWPDPPSQTKMGLKLQMQGATQRGTKIIREDTGARCLRLQPVLPGWASWSWASRTYSQMLGIHSLSVTLMPPIAGFKESQRQPSAQTTPAMSPHTVQKPIPEERL